MRKTANGDRSHGVGRVTAGATRPAVVGHVDIGVVDRSRFEGQ
jgi:hypothetical protein